MDRDTFPKINTNTLESFPIPKSEPQNKSEKQLHDEIVKLVDTILQLNQQKQTATLPEQINQLEKRIAHTDESINKKVYLLYGLTEDEIKIVEGA